MAGGFAPALVATKFGAHPALSVSLVGLWAVFFEAVLQKKMYGDTYKKHPKWKSYVDVAAWVGGAYLGTLAGG
jgi:hypothetical protein